MMAQMTHMSNEDGGYNVIPACCGALMCPSAENGESELIKQHLRCNDATIPPEVAAHPRQNKGKKL